MRLTPVNFNETFTNGYKKTKNFKLLTEFIEMGVKCAVVEDVDKIYVKASNLRRSAERFRITGVKVTIREGKLYLINENID